MSPTKARRPRRSSVTQIATHTVDRFDEVRVLAHPLRLKLLELFAAQPRTTKQAAAVLGENPTRLYHHVNALERVGLIALRETRQNRGTTEKYYGALARRIEVNRAMFAPPAAGSRTAKPGRDAAALAATLLDSVRDDLASAPSGPDVPVEDRPVLMRVTLHGTGTQLRALRREFMDHVQALGKTCARNLVAAKGAKRGAAEPVERWTLTLAFVPAAPVPARRRASRRPRSRSGA